MDWRHDVISDCEELIRGERGRRKERKPRGDSRVSNAPRNSNKFARFLFGSFTRSFSHAHFSLA